MLVQETHIPTTLIQCNTWKFLVQESKIKIFEKLKLYSCAQVHPYPSILHKPIQPTYCCAHTQGYAFTYTLTSDPTHTHVYSRFKNMHMHAPKVHTLASTCTHSCTSCFIFLQYTMHVHMHPYPYISIQIYTTHLSSCSDI